jgi:two-component system, NarL family, sensor histidine kinase DesK
MIGWMRRRRAAWRGRSRHGQVEASTRWSLAGLPWFMLLSGLGPLPVRAADTTTATVLVWSVVAANAVLCTTASVLVPRALAAYLGERGAPWRATAVLGLEAVVAVGLTTALVVADGLTGGAAEGIVLMISVGLFLMPYSLLVSVRTMTWTLVGLIALGVCGFGAVGVDLGQLLGVALVTAFGGCAMAFSTRCSGWYILVLRELDEARDAQSQLAVAEERLRFGRDLHDVLGRNLSVIALKSELAVQLARRGGGREAEAALDQMVEVQRIAHDSQREVREVVRGYREADLTTELAGARGVLRAAGIDCRVAADGAPQLPEPARAALAWVVREGTTNVLRHADAARCTVTVRTSAASAVLTMENDGVPAEAVPAGGSGGAGLAGLGERLARLHGVLTSERPAPSVFRLTAEIPLTGSAADDDELVEPPEGTAEGSPTAQPTEETVRAEALAGTPAGGAGRDTAGDVSGQAGEGGAAPAGEAPAREGAR